MEIEVSLKVRSAIKAKLLELGVHVDDELPDYIMVLVANRRSKPQMESDLELFLSENTQKFTTWLFHVLRKLEQVTLADSLAVLNSKDKPEPAAASSSATHSKTKDTKASHEKDKPSKTTESSKSSAKGVVKGSSTNKGSDKSVKVSKSSASKESTSSTKSTTLSTKSDKHKKKDEGHEKERRHSKSGSSTGSSKSEKANDGKVQFKLKNNLVKQTEFDRKQAEAEGKKPEKSGTQESDESHEVPTEEQTGDGAHEQEDKDILNFGDEDAEDLFGSEDPQEVSVKNAVSTQPETTKADDDSDVEKLRKIALETKASNRRKLDSGNVTALRGMVLNFEKENSNKRKRQSDEAESKDKDSTSHSKSDKSKTTEDSSRPKRLRSVVSTVNKPSEEYDPERPKIHKLSSVVCVTGDKRPKRDTTSMNSNLIMKAMKEVEIDNIKRPMKSGEEDSKSRRRSSGSGSGWELDRTGGRGWRIARSPSKPSRDRDRVRDQHRSPRSRDHSERERENTHRGRVRRDSSRERRNSHRSRHDRSRSRSRSRSPLQLFTKRGRMNIRDRLGEKQASNESSRRSSRADVQDEDLLDDSYLKEIKDIENDLNIIINVPNLDATSLDTNDAKLEKGKANEASPKLSEDTEMSPSSAPVESINPKKGRGYVAPNRISIQVMNSSDESDSEEETERKVVVQQESESEAELEVTVNQEQDIDDLLPPQQQHDETEGNIEEKEEKKTEGKPDRLTDLRAKLAAITRTNTSSYSPLQLQPSRPPAPVAAPAPPPAAPIRASAPYLTPYFYDSLPPMLSDQNALLGSTTCKFWPTCSFGENCKYTHPKCKFGDGCVKRPNCPFKHDADPYGIFTSAAIYKAPPPSHYTGSAAPSKKLCRFFPKCNSVDCVFYHPKPCRYGVNCVDPNCTHFHPGGSIGEKKSGAKLPAVHQLKWQKDKTV